MTRIWILFMLILPFAVAQAEMVEVEIHGMTCAFCVEGLRRELSELPDVSEVNVSLKNKKVRIASVGETLDLDRVRKAVIDAGFTPVEVRHLDSGTN